MRRERVPRSASSGEARWASMWSAAAPSPTTTSISPRTSGASSWWGVDGDGYSLGVETGRRIEMGGKTRLTPRAWFTRRSVSVDSFTDAVNARVSFSDAHRFIAGLGLGDGSHASPRRRGVLAACIAGRRADLQRRGDVDPDIGRETPLGVPQKRVCTGPGRRLSLGPLLDRCGDDDRSGVPVPAPRTTPACSSSEHIFSPNFSPAEQYGDEASRFSARGRERGKSSG